MVEEEEYNFWSTKPAHTRAYLSENQQHQHSCKKIHPCRMHKRFMRLNFPNIAAKLANQRDALRQTNHSDPNIRKLSNRRQMEELLRKTELCQHNKQLGQFPNSAWISWTSSLRHIQHARTTPKSAYWDVFSPEDVTLSIKFTNTCKTLGPDNIAPIMLKHLGQKATKHLTDVLNLSIKTLVWKVGQIIPIHKSGNPTDQENSYQPAVITIINGKSALSHPPKYNSESNAAQQPLRCATYAPPHSKRFECKEADSRTIMVALAMS